MGSLKCTWQVCLNLGFLCLTGTSVSSSITTSSFPAGLGLDDAEAADVRMASSKSSSACSCSASDNLSDRCFGVVFDPNRCFGVGLGLLLALSD